MDSKGHISFTEMLVAPCDPITFSCDSHMATYFIASPPIDKASRKWRHVAGASPSFGHAALTLNHSRRGLWKAIQPEILLSPVAMPPGTLTFW